MKYKVGDKVRVRSDLKISVLYGNLCVLDEMLKKKIVTIASVHDGYYKVVEDEYEWTDEMFEGLVEDELTAEEAIKMLGDMCIIGCEICKLRELYKESGYSLCADYRREHPDKVVEILKQRKKEYEKKEIETEIVDLIRIMKEEGDSATCIYTHEIDAKEKNIYEKMDELVKQYYEENGGKIYAKFERICRVKS